MSYNAGKMVVRCDTIEQFMDVVAGAVMRGLLFSADAETLTVHFSGGY